MPVVAHITDVVPGNGSGFSLAFGLLAIAVVALMVEHHVVKHGGFDRGALRRAAAVALAVTVAGLAMPGSAESQERTAPVGLPDMMSRPPFIWFDKIVEQNGEYQRVLAFDGFLYNAGPGVLDVTGNPQEPGGVKQRYYDGEGWVDIGTPVVEYETTDGHNHFHLMAAAEYTLWDVARTEQIGVAAKVGFCLVDSQAGEGIEGDPFYATWCEESRPETTSLEMGISPGWIDVYDANTTLQWVDVSNVQPGVYWIGAVIDPLDRIVEENEDNNDLVFSQNRFAVAGYVARGLAAGPGTIELQADVHGVVDAPVWQVTSAPENGTLSVPVGVDLHSAELSYTPDPGFTGTDRFEFSARDLASPFPKQPHTATVEIVVDAESASSDDVDPNDESSNELAGIEVDAELGLEQFGAYQGPPWTAEDSGITWFATDLPAGLSIDQATGVISGAPMVPGSSAAIITAHDSPNGEPATWSVQFDVRPSQSLGYVLPTGRISVSYREPVRHTIGALAPSTAIRAEGLPQGLILASTQIVGQAEEVGVFDVTIQVLEDDVVVDEVSTVVLVRPSTYPDFPL